jgi:hypothetical protein
VDGLVPDVTGIQSAVLPILAVGAAIVGAFVLFKLGKRAANRL